MESCADGAEDQLFGQLVEGGTVTERYLRDATKVDLEEPFTGGPIELGFDRFFGCAACPTTDWIYSFLEGDRTVGVPSEAVVFETSEHAEMPGGWYRDGIATPGWQFEEVDPTFVGEARAWLAETDRAGIYMWSENFCKIGMLSRDLSRCPSR